MEAKEAFETLSNDRKRQEYDRHLRWQVGWPTAFPAYVQGTCVRMPEGLTLAVLQNLGRSSAPGSAPSSSAGASGFGPFGSTPSEKARPGTPQDSYSLVGDVIAIFLLYVILLKYIYMMY